MIDVPPYQFYKESILFHLSAVQRLLAKFFYGGANAIDLKQTVQLFPLAAKVLHEYFDLLKEDDKKEVAGIAKQTLVYFDMFNSMPEKLRRGVVFELIEVIRQTANYNQRKKRIRLSPKEKEFWKLIDAHNIPLNSIDFIHGRLEDLNFKIARSTVAKYLSKAT